MASQTRPASIVSVLAALVLISGCSGDKDQRLESLSVGISKDSVLAIIGVEKPQRIDPYLVDGQYIEAMYFAKPGSADSTSVMDRNMSPVIVVDGKLVVWGWKQWDSMAALKKIEVAK